MAGELRIMENKSREDINLSPKKNPNLFIFLYSFSSYCFILLTSSKLRFLYNQYIRIRHILNPSLKVLTKCQAQSTSNFDNIALAYKAAELQSCTCRTIYTFNAK